MDYISMGWGLLFLCITPFLISKSPYDVFLVFSWISTLVFLNLPMHHLTVPLQISCELQQVLFLVTILSFVALLKAKIKNETLYKILGWIGFINLAFTAISWFLPGVDGGRFIYGLISNKAMNGILNLMLWPYMVRMKDRISAFSLLNLPLLFTYHSSSAWASFVAIATFCIFNFVLENKIKMSVFGFSILSAVGFFAKEDLFNGTTRWDGYRFFFSQLSKRDWVIGYGPASFFTMSIYFQEHFKFQTPSQMYGYYLWLHSDPLQLIWEMGLVSIPFILWTIYKVFRVAGFYEKTALIAILVGSAFYYPFHYPIHLIALFLVLKIVANDSGHFPRKDMD